MGAISVRLTRRGFARLRAHLLATDPRAEEAAFLYTREHGEGGRVLEVVAMDLLPSSAFDTHGYGHMILADGVLDRAVKRAHDLEAGLGEVHSHPYPGRSAACFSPSDLAGLAEVVPHARWRLPSRPYVALVMSLESLDGLAWSTGSEPGPVSVHVGRERQALTELSLPAWRRFHGSV